MTKNITFRVVRSVIDPECPIALMIEAPGDTLPYTVHMSVNEAMKIWRDLRLLCESLEEGGASE